jgi:hypothetical protein
MHYMILIALTRAKIFVCLLTGTFLLLQWLQKAVGDKTMACVVNG